MNELNFAKYKFMILRCTRNDLKCGGLGDRLRGLPFFIAAAARTLRIFMIRWDRPTRLEEFLVPNEVNWSVPEWMLQQLWQGNVSSVMSMSGMELMRSYENESAAIVEGKIQDFFGGSALYHKIVVSMDNTTASSTDENLDGSVGWREYQWIFHDLFRVLFKPSLPVAQLISERLRSANLTPGNYVSSHHRAFYGIEYARHKSGPDEALRRSGINAVNCASQLSPGVPVYFASDSLVSIQAVRDYAFQRNLPIIAPIHDETVRDALHLDKDPYWRSRNASDFYATFVDLLIMSNGQCQSHGIGGFGSFGALLSRNATCTVRHGITGQTDDCEWTSTVHLPSVKLIQN
jgi:hypothetical protein